MEHLSSLINPKIKYLIKLRDDAKFRTSEKKFFIQGMHSVQEAMKHNAVFEIYATEKVVSSFNLTSFSTVIINEKIAEKIASTKSNQGIFAVCNQPDTKLDFNSNTLILDTVQDPGNIGTLIRSAAAFGFKNIIASHDCASFFNEKVLRSTQGMIFNLNMINCNLNDQILVFKNKNYQIIGTFLNNEAIYLKDTNNLLGSKVCLIVGNEGNGISKELKSLIDENVKIEMSEDVESLNASVAGSMIMYHFYKKK